MYRRRNATDTTDSRVSRKIHGRDDVSPGGVPLKIENKKNKTRTDSREVVVSRIDEGFKPTTTRPAKKEPKRKEKTRMSGSGHSKKKEENAHIFNSFH